MPRAPRKPSHALLVLLTLCFSAAWTACQQNPSPTEVSAVRGVDEKAHFEETEAWHEDRLESLQSEDGWLTLVGLHWLEPDENRVGSGEENQVILPAAAPQRLGTLTWDPGAEAATVFTPAPDAQVSVGDDPAPVQGPVALVSDAEAEPTLLRSGTVSFYVIDREGRLAVRVKDSAAATRTDFAGIERFPVDKSWRIDASYQPFEAPRSIQVPTVLGIPNAMISPGSVRFERDGREFVLDALAGGNAREVWFVFADETNTQETYGGGRFVYTRFTEGDSGTAGPLVVDFNRAYNPPCVFTPYATCPLPTEQNRLALAVTSGEKYPGH